MWGPGDPPLPALHPCRSRPSSDIPGSGDPKPEPRLLRLAGVMRELQEGQKLPMSLYCCWQPGPGAMLGYAGGHDQKALGTSALGRKSIQEEINLVMEQSLRPGQEGKI